jgi:hypothetical protein
MSCGVSDVRSVNYSMLHGERGDTSGQKCTLYRVKRTVYYKKARYMGSIKTCQLQECTLYGVKKDLAHKKARILIIRGLVIIFCNVVFLSQCLSVKRL